MALKRGGTDTTPAPTGDPFRDQRIAWREAIEKNRDQWQRPKIMLPDGSKETGYRRASSYGSPLEDSTNLDKWRMRQVMRGVARSRAIRLEVTRAETGLDSDNRDEVRLAKKAFHEKENGLVDRAMNLVGSGDAASIGTSMHDIHERIDRGLDPGHVPEEFAADVDVYLELTRYFRMVSIERFIVQDDHKVAGTLDRAAEVLVPLILPSGKVLRVGDVVILDEKTAQSMDFAGVKFGVQSWVYATGVPYDPIEKVRLEWGHTAPRTDVALIAHVPSGQGRADVYEIDLEEAGEAAVCAREVYAWRNSRGKNLIQRAPSHADAFAELEKVLSEATDHASLKALARQASQAGIWCPEVRDLFSARKAELGRHLEAVA